MRTLNMSNHHLKIFGKSNPNLWMIFFKFNQGTFSPKTTGQNLKMNISVKLSDIHSIQAPKAAASLRRHTYLGHHTYNCFSFSAPKYRKTV